MWNIKAACLPLHIMNAYSNATTTVKLTKKNSGKHMVPLIHAITGDISFTLASTLEPVKEDWLQAEPQDNLFLQYRYLRILEMHPPLGMRFRFIVFYKKNIPAGVALCQLINFKADQSLQGDETEEKNPCFFNTFARYLKGWVASKVEFDSLVCGNLLLTGEHGYYMNGELIPIPQQTQALNEALNQLILEEEKHKTRLSVILLKDYEASNTDIRSSFSTLEYNEFTVQPSMILDIPPHWKSMDDYADDLHSKYRVRWRRALKKGKDIVKKELNATEVEAYLPKIHELYLQIATNAGFNLVSLNEAYLLGMKESLENEFRVFGYFLKGELIAFYTTVDNGKELEAHFLGFEQSLNHDLQIYLNILYDILEVGIISGVEKIIYARTAMEIKSSVGAVAHEMYCYLRHRNSFSNRFMKPLLLYLRPDAPWEPRHPFKHQEL